MNETLIERAIGKVAFLILVLGVAIPAVALNPGLAAAVWLGGQKRRVSLPDPAPITA